VTEKVAFPHCRVTSVFLRAQLTDYKCASLPKLKPHVCMYRVYRVGAAIKRKRETTRSEFGAGSGLADWMTMEHESVSHIRHNS